MTPQLLLPCGWTPLLSARRWRPTSPLLLECPDAASCSLPKQAALPPTYCRLMRSLHNAVALRGHLLLLPVRLRRRSQEGRLTAAPLVPPTALAGPTHRRAAALLTQRVIDLHARTTALLPRGSARVASARPWICVYTAFAPENGPSRNRRSRRSAPLASPARGPRTRLAVAPRGAARRSGLLLARMKVGWLGVGAGNGPGRLVGWVATGLGGGCRIPFYTWGVE